MFHGSSVFFATITLSSLFAPIHSCFHPNVNNIKARSIDAAILTRENNLARRNRPIAPRRKVALNIVMVFDGVQILPSSTKVIDGEWIGFNATGVEEHIDGQGGILLPGLIELHCHPASVTNLEQLSAYVLPLPFYNRAFQLVCALRSNVKWVSQMFALLLHRRQHRIALTLNFHTGLITKPWLRPNKPNRKFEFSGSIPNVPQHYGYASHHNDKFTVTHASEFKQHKKNLKRRPKRSILSPVDDPSVTDITAKARRLYTMQRSEASSNAELEADNGNVYQKVLELIEGKAHSSTRAFVHEKLRYEYDVRKQQLSVKMRTTERDSIAETWKALVMEHVKLFEGHRNPKLANLAKKIKSRCRGDIEVPDYEDKEKYSKYCPDLTFQIPGTAHGSVYTEVVYSTKFEDPESKIREYFRLSGTRVAFIIHVPYNQTDKFYGTVSTYRWENKDKLNLIRKPQEYLRQKSSEFIKFNLSELAPEEFSTDWTSQDRKEGQMDISVGTLATQIDQVIFETNQNRILAAAEWDSVLPSVPLKCTERLTPRRRSFSDSEDYLSLPITRKQCLFKDLSCKPMAKRPIQAIDDDSPDELQSEPTRSEPTRKRRRRRSKRNSDDVEISSDVELSRDGSGFGSS
ncbi:hypothetical protein MMC13_001107 [Lambiella insularis]|nr:hypothetical protein [Lambiella insularis]